MKQSMNNHIKKTIIRQFIYDAVFIILLYLLLLWLYPCVKSAIPDSYSIADTIKQMCSFWEACIAIYIGVISIFATARTSVADKLSKEHKYYNFVASTSVGFINTVITLISTNILYDINFYTKIFTATMVIISLFKIIAFFMYVLIIFSFNVSNSYIETTVEEEKHNEIINNLNIIQNILSDIIRKNK